MPTLPSSAKVLVTGASGFLGSHVTRTLLNQGYSVVGTVRTHAKGDYLVNLHKTNRFSYAIVENIEAKNAFDDVVRSHQFDGISHVASPFTMGAKGPDDFIIPAVEGTKNVLNAALKYGTNIKRVVVTSASAAILQPHKYPYTYSEADWNDAAIQAVEDGTADGVLMYQASKTLGERAAWEWMAAHQREVTFDLVVVNPPWMFGPVIHQVTTPASLNLSEKLLFGVMKAKQEDLTPEKTGKNEHYLGDVREVAVAHLRAFTVPEAAGKRFLCSDSPWCHQDVYDLLNEIGAKGIPRGFPGSKDPKINLHDNSRSRQILGMQYSGFNEVITAAYMSFKEHFPSQF